MAKAGDDPTAPADQPSSTPGNPHFRGRYTPTAHKLRPELMQTAYSARQMLADFVRVTRERADSPGVTEEHKAVLKNNIERVEPALSGLVGVLNQRGQSDLLDVVWACFHIGRVGGPRLRNRLEAMRRDEAIRKRLENGEHPASTETWDRFCDHIRDDCAGWKDKKERKPKRGYSDRQIKRVVSKLRQR